MKNTLASPRKETVETIDANGNPIRIVCEYGFDGTFAVRNRQLPHLSVTAKTYERRRGEWCAFRSGCDHETVRDHFPHLADLCTFHGCTSAGPMHYPDNAVFLAGTADHWGLEAGEFRQSHDKQGRPAWRLVRVGSEDDDTAMHRLATNVHYGSMPENVPTLAWVPWGRTGTGKARELESARGAACWPDATDAELSVPSAELRAVLVARLPALLQRFRDVCAAAGCPVPHDDGTEAGPAE